jgi:hypothetical protein
MNAAAKLAACEDRERLVRAYKFAVSDYSRAVMSLQRRSGVMSKHDYEEIQSFATKTRDLAEHTRAVLDKHIAEHGCQPDVSRPAF